MPGKVNITIQIDRQLTEKVTKKFSEQQVTRSGVMRMLMAEIVREQRLPRELQISNETNYFLQTEDKVPNAFLVDEDLKIVCERTLRLLHTNLAEVVAAFYTYVANSEEAPFGVIQLMLPYETCRAIVPVTHKLMREFNEVLEQKGITLKSAIIAFMRQTVGASRPVPVNKHEKIIEDLLGPSRPEPEATANADTEQAATQQFTFPVMVTITSPMVAAQQTSEHT